MVASISFLRRMNTLSRIAIILLTFLPVRFNDIIRQFIPNSIKRKLGTKIMQSVNQGEHDEEIIVQDGRKFLKIEDRLFLRVVFDKDYEPFLSAIPKKILSKEDNAVDVGANFGWYTTLFSSMIDGGKVFAYEPAKRTFHVLSENIKKNNLNNIIFKNIGVGSVEGLMMLDQGGERESGLAHIVDSSNENSIEVKIVSLGTDLEDYKNEIAYIKIDVEGFEKNVLDGATQILEVENQPIIQIELNEEALVRAGSSRSETLSILSKLGYEFWEIDKSKKGFLKKSDLSNCSDVFCFGRGKFRDRLHLVS